MKIRRRSLSFTGRWGCSFGQAISWCWRTGNGQSIPSRKRFSRGFLACFRRRNTGIRCWFSKKHSESTPSKNLIILCPASSISQWASMKIYQKGISWCRTSIPWKCWMPHTLSFKEGEKGSWLIPIQDKEVECKWKVVICECRWLICWRLIFLRQSFHLFFSRQKLVNFQNHFLCIVIGRF